MSKTRTVRFPILRIAIDAVLVALYFGLSWLSVEIGGIKLTFAGLPAMICAMIYGPIDGFLVGFLGAFCEQMLKYGFTPTTLLWVLGPAVRGLFIGCCKLIFKKSMAPENLLKAKRPYVFFAVCIVSGVLVSLLNTMAFYVDAKMFHYYTYELIFGVLWLRLLSGILSSVLMSMLTLTVLAAVRHTTLVPKKVRT